MKTLDIAEYAYQSLRKRRLRSWLTILGIVIGVASIITLISIANGVEAQITSRLNLLGNNVIQVTPGNAQATRQRVGGFAFPVLGGGGSLGGGGERSFGMFTRAGAGKLSFDDARNLARVDGVSKIDARIEGQATVSIAGKEARVQIVGVDPAAFNELSASTPLVSGRKLNPSDKFTAVIGSRVYSRLFEGQDLLNRQVKVVNNFNDSYSFRVVGLLNATSGSMVVSDNAVYVPVEAAKTVLNASNPSVFFILVRDGYTADEVAAELEKQLLALHRVSADKPDFTITTAAFLESTVADVTNTLSLFLGGIAAISLLVGAIGVANTMFMSVLERIKEIGILKALGLKDGEVLRLFLFESAAIGLVGGVLGIALSFALSLVLVAFGIPSIINAELVALGLAFSAFVGIVSGVVPARNAARL
ncbi:MAG: ABC transporter permease, partial [Candidatus Norongarragalinales archaeon]